jgi:hypothetical protein
MPIVGCAENHAAGTFGKLARGIGLEGKLTATHAGEALKARLNAIADALGEYPHAALRPTMNEKKQTTRLLKAQCSECGCVIRITRKWVDEAEGHGSLVCPMPQCECAMDVEEKAA